MKRAITSKSDLFFFLYIRNVRSIVTALWCCQTLALRIVAVSYGYIAPKEDAGSPLEKILKSFSMLVIKCHASIWKQLVLSSTDLPFLRVTLLAAVSAAKLMVWANG